MRAPRTTVGNVAAVLLAAIMFIGCDDDSSSTAADTQYAVVLHLEETTGPVGALQVEIDYVGPDDGGWIGAGGTVACRWIVDAELHACNDKRGGALSCAVVDVDGFTGPTDLAECTFVAKTDSLTASDFDVQVVDASAPDLSPIQATVTVTVTASPSDTTTTTDPDGLPPQFSVAFEMGTASRPVGALQFETRHAGASGGWIGANGGAECQWLVAYSLAACNDRGRLGLACAVVDTTGFEGPAPLLECGFASFDDVTPDDFSILVVDASATDLTPLDVDVFVASVTPR